MTTGNTVRLAPPAATEAAPSAPQHRACEIRSTSCTETEYAQVPQSVWAAVFEHSSEGVVVCDASQRILLVNPTFEHITGYSLREVQGKTPRILQSGRHGADFYRDLWRGVDRAGYWHGEVCNRRKNGELYYEWLTVCAARDACGGVANYVGIFSDITQRKRIEDRVNRLANFDSLTELPNRKQLLSRMEELIEASRRAKTLTALLVVDLDRFKTINDSIGHEAGDALLKTVARRLNHLVRRADVVARLDGDEFGIALSRIEGREDAAQLAQRVLDEIALPHAWRGQELVLSGSVGICVFPGDADNASEMMRNAESAMYVGRSGGRNRYRFYSRDMSQQAREALSTETALRQALQRGEFELYFQPQVDVAQGALIGAEALIRWNRPGIGLVMPGQFIQIAEESGLIGAIGEWTIEAASRQAAAWDAAGMPAIKMAVNLSATQFHEPGFVASVLRTLRSHGIMPARFELEITEGVILKDADATIDILRQLHDAGLRLSIDDFGTGYSSLSYLRRFPIDVIKIDQSFVREMLDDVGAAGIVRGIIALAKGLQLDVIAEGVERPEQLRFLRDTHCNAAQGFLFGRGMPAREFESVARRWHAK